MEFYKETNLKFVEELGCEIPEDWEVVRLGDVAEIIMGQSPPSSTYNNIGEGLPFLQGKAEFGEIYPSPSVYCSKPLKIAELNDILLSVRAPVGDVNLAPFRCCIGRGLAAIRPKNDKLNYLFLFYYLKSNRKRFEIISSGSTFKAIRKKDIENYLIPFPPLEEQKKIAEILSTVDQAIQKTDEIIAKTERLKKGLMQELLSGRVRIREEDGRISFYRETRFKDTEIGKIPEDWEVVRLKEVAEIRKNKNKVRNDFIDVAFIPMELIPDSEIFVKYEIRNISEISSSTYCEANDLLLAKISPSFENGKQGIVPKDIPNGFAFATTEVYPIVCKDINNIFLFYLLKFQKFRKLLEFSMRGTTGRRRVPKKAVEELNIPLPPLEEQKKIAEILSAVDKKLEIERKEKEKLKRIKKGLMDVLLTGRVRVKLDVQSGT